MLEKANDGNRKEFWAFEGRRTKCRKRPLRNNAGVLVTDISESLSGSRF